MVSVDTDTVTVHVAVTSRNFLKLWVSFPVFSNYVTPMVNSINLLLSNVIPQVESISDQVGPDMTYMQLTEH